MKQWVYDPHSGGNKIPKNIHEKLCKDIEAFACMRPWYPRIQIRPRFKGQFCYIETIETGNEDPLPLCRLRYLTNGWSLALFMYGNDRYMPCSFSKGKLEGTLEEALVICEPFII